jgi:N-methylhydantoinase A/oxoprolinase/acetone carboxylase beta subunit
MASTKIGIDVGGTFTDFLLTVEGEEPRIFKVLSTPADPSIGVIEGLKEMAAAVGQSLEDFAGGVETVVHGTTVTTNAVLTSMGAKTGLITTEGMRDALEMRRGIREEQYNNRYTNVEPLVPRYRRLGVGGRLDRRPHGQGDRVPGSRRRARGDVVPCRGRRRGGGDLLHERLRQPRPRGPGRRDRARGPVGRLPHGLKRSAALDPLL